MGLCGEYILAGESGTGKVIVRDMRKVCGDIGEANVRRIRVMVEGRTVEQACGVMRGASGEMIVIGIDRASAVIGMAVIKL